jgi:hypothetical protein
VATVVSFFRHIHYLILFFFSCRFAEINSESDSDTDCGGAEQNESKDSFTSSIVELEGDMSDDADKPQV